MTGQWGDIRLKMRKASTHLNLMTGYFTFCFHSLAAMAEHVFAFLNTLGIDSCDVLRFSLGGVIAQQMALDNPKCFTR